jgi:hypothetical protein
MSDLDGSRSSFTGCLQDMMSKQKRGAQTYEPAQGSPELDSAQPSRRPSSGAHRSLNAIAFEDT